jgi:hypothetical protein
MKIMANQLELPLEVLQSLTAHIAILNEQGAIVFTNRAWDRFAPGNGGNPAGLGVGTDYLQACGQSIGDNSALQALAGIQAVQHGKRELFELVYPYDSPDQERWFVMQATRMSPEYPAWVVVTHIDITGQIQSGLARAAASIEAERIDRQDREFASLDKLRMVNPAMATSGTFGLAPFRDLFPEIFGDLLLRYENLIILELMGCLVTYYRDHATHLYGYQDSPPNPG